MTKFDSLVDRNGCVVLDGVRYALLGQATLTNNVFPGWWGGISRKGNPTLRSGLLPSPPAKKQRM
jgi:hypothetical protein